MNRTMSYWQYLSSVFDKKGPVHVGSITMDMPVPHTTPAKLRLCYYLMEKLMPRCNIKMMDLKLDYDSLGCPQLDCPGVLVSFSYCNNTLWCAVGNSVSLGIDAAISSEFTDDYPFHRVFHTSELKLVQQICHDTTNGAAFLWACKEAVVKSLGTGFHTIDPCDITITSYLPDGTGYEVAATSSKQHSLAISSHLKQWIAVAV